MNEPAQQPRPAVVFFGTPAFSMPYLRVLHELADVRAVVCQPDKPVGRGRKVQAPPVKELALELGLPVHQPQTLRGDAFAAWLEELAPVLSFVVAYGKLLPKRVLEAPRLGSVNAHASLLPRWRGASPIAQAILAGDAHTGVCLMQMDEGMDTGPVLARSELAIDEADTTATLSERLSAAGAELLATRFADLVEGRLAAVPQQEAGATAAPLLRKEDGRLRLQDGALACSRRVRAMAPWPGAFFELDGQRIKVLEASAQPKEHHDGLVAGAVSAANGAGSAAAGVGSAMDGTSSADAPGDEVEIGMLRLSPRGELWLRCAASDLQIEVLQLPGGKAMTAKAFIAGRGRQLLHPSAP